MKQDSIPHWPRGLSRAYAAGYIGVSLAIWDRMVADGTMPKPKRTHVQPQSLANVTADPFGVDEAAPHAVRISLGAASSRRELVRALEVVAAALKPSAARTRVI